MAEIYAAKEATDEFSRVIAVKRMLDGIARDAAMVPMFVDEAKLASRLSHPNISQIYELGRTDGALYIAMELIWGHDLRNIAKACARRRVPFPPSIACYVIAKAAEALDFAHNAVGPDGRPMRLVHRDVSPQNIMMDYEGEIKVIDFGIAKADAKQVSTVAGVIKGKFSYMAPEQIEGASVDARSDIFALGIVLYEILSGERLFDGSNVFSIYEKVVKHPVPRVADSTEVAPELDAVVARCLSHDPHQRFQTAAQLADALAPFRIQERNIVGRREAASFLRELFPDDEAAMQARQARYRAITELDCFDPSHEVDPAELQRTQIFMTADRVPVLAKRERADTVTEHDEIAPLSTGTDVQPNREFRATEKIDVNVSYLGLGIAVACIALIACLIIVIARSRNMTAMELFEEVVHRQAATATR